MPAGLIGYFAPATAAVLCILFLYRCLVYPYWLSPLAKIPSAHWTSPFIPWWILWKRYRQQELPAASEAHQRLGPVVRLGPKDLSVSCYDGGIRTIYGGGFDKPAYFDVFNYYGLEFFLASYQRCKLTTSAGDRTLSVVLQNGNIRSTGEGSPSFTLNPRCSVPNS